jgi:hypothetical protein
MGVLLGMAVTLAGITDGDGIAVAVKGLSVLVDTGMDVDVDVKRLGVLVDAEAEVGVAVK